MWRWSSSRSSTYLWRSFLSFAISHGVELLFFTEISGRLTPQRVVPVEHFDFVNFGGHRFEEDFRFFDGGVSFARGRSFLVEPRQGGKAIGIDDCRTETMLDDVFCGFDDTQNSPMLMVWFPIFCSKRSSPVAKSTALYRVTPLFIECAPSVAIPCSGRIIGPEWAVCRIRRRPFSAEVLRQRI